MPGFYVGRPLDPPTRLVPPIREIAAWLTEGSHPRTRGKPVLERVRLECGHVTIAEVGKTHVDCPECPLVELEAYVHAGGNRIGPFRRIVEVLVPGISNKVPSKVRLVCGHVVWAWTRCDGSEGRSRSRCSECVDPGIYRKVPRVPGHPGDAMP